MADWIEPPEEELGLKSYVATIRERLGLVLVATLVTTAVAVLYVLTATKTYESEADLLVSPVASDTFPSLPLLRESADATRDVETAARLVTDSDVAARVRTELGNNESLDSLKKKVKAEPVAQSDIVALTAQGDSPAEARELANAFARAAVADRTELLHSAIDTQVAAIQAQLQTGGPQPGLSAELARLQSLRGAPDPTIRIETLGNLPTQAAKPRPALTIAGGLLAGLIIGVVAAFAAQILDPRLRREEQLKRRYRLPILARVPREWRPGPNPLGPRDITAASREAYRMLRVTLDKPRKGTSGRALLITGASPSEGKTTVALNLAASLALAGRRVILIEADLRRPALTPSLGVPEAQAGVVSVLIESTALEDALTPSPVYGDNLQFLGADFSDGSHLGERPYVDSRQWIAELFSIPAAQRLIDDARKRADYVIVDSPPPTEVVDALPFARKCDDVLIVARLGTTHLDKLAQLADLLAEDDITPAGFAVIGTPRSGLLGHEYYGEHRREASPAPSAEAVPSQGPPHRNRTPSAKSQSGQEWAPVSEGALLLATQMAAAGNTRDEIAKRLREDYGISDARGILDEAGL
jgi:polysaccharide biosynthesis transport protein